MTVFLDTIVLTGTSFRNTLPADMVSGHQHLRPCLDELILAFRLCRDEMEVHGCVQLISASRLQVRRLRSSAYASA